MTRQPAPPPGPVHAPAALVASLAPAALVAPDASGRPVLAVRWRAAATLAAEGIEAAVLDLRTVAPLDTAAIVEQARRTGRVVVVDEDYRGGGLSGEVAALLLEEQTGATFARVTVEQTIPFAPHLEYAALPNPERIVAATRALVHPRRDGSTR